MRADGLADAHALNKRKENGMPFARGVTQEIAGRWTHHAGMKPFCTVIILRGTDVGGLRLFSPLGLFSRVGFNLIPNAVW